MDLTQTHALLGRLVERMATGTSDEAPAAIEEDVADFLSTQRFARERQQFFLDTPQILGFVGEVREPGSFITAEALGIPVVVTRDRSGVLHALVNACAHRGGEVARGRGKQSRLACRSHAWTYDLDGSLHSRPQGRCFDTPDRSCDLIRLPVSERSGLLVVGLHRGVAQTVVDEHLCEIEPQLRGFAFDQLHYLATRRYEVNANWKLVAALSYESYHFASLHPDTVAEWFSPNAVHDFFGRHSRWAFARRGTETLREQPASQWPTSIPGAVSHALFPGTVVITTPGDAQILRTEPGASPDRSVIHYIGACRDPAKAEESLAAYEFGGRAFESEDLPAAAQSQRGLSAGRERILIGRNEPVVQFWHQLWRGELKT